MQPFLITCETCHARLKVTSAVAIGQILACPKCQSMVRVIAPETATDTLEIEPARRAGEGGRRWGDEDPNRAGQGSPAEVPGESPNATSLPATSGTSTPANTAESNPPGVTASARPDGIPAEMAGQRLLLYLLGGTMLGLVALAIAGFWWSQRPSQQPAQNQTQEIPDPSRSVPSQKNPSIAVLGSQDPKTGGLENRSDPDRALGPNRADSEGNRAADGLEPAVDRPAIQPRPEAIEEARHGTEPPPEPPTDNLVDRPRNRLKPSGQPERGVAESEPIDTGSNRTDTDSEPPQAVNGPENQGDPAVQEIPNTALATNVQMAPPDPAAMQFQDEEAWSLSVARYQARRIPLAIFLDDMAALAGAPIDLDLESLARVGATSQTPVSIDAKETTLLEILEEALKPIGLIPRIHTTYLVIENPGEDFSEHAAGPTSRQAVSTQAKLQSILDRPTTFSFIDWTPLETIRREWQRLFGLTILVDWRSLAKIGLQPKSRIQCAVINRPIGDSLSAILSELDMTWIAVDECTIQITAHRWQSGR